MTIDDWTSPKGLLIVGMVALVTGAAATGTAFASSKSRKEASLARILDVGDSALLNRYSAGDAVLVGGKLAADNTALFRGYVAYLEYEPYRKRSNRRRKSSWDVVRRETPALGVETASGRVRVSNTDYQVGAAVRPPLSDLDEWGSTSWKGAPASALPGSADHWFTGFKAGESVVILGTLERTGKVPEVKALRVFSGTSDDLARAARDSSQSLWFLTRVLFGVCGVSVAALGGLGLRYAREH